MPAQPQEDADVYEFPASTSQSRLLMLERLHPGSAQYNVPIAFAVSGPFDLAALGAALEAVTARHEALRTTFRTSGDEELQVVSSRARVELRVRDAASAEAADAALLEEAHRPFDLEHGPLLRTTVYRLPDGTHRLLLSLHHVICDGWSLKLILEELGDEYRAARTGEPSDVAEPAIQYPDFSAWHRQRTEAGEYAEAIEHWYRVLAGAPLTPAVPTDRPRPSVQTTAGAGERFLLPPDLRERVAGFARSVDATEYTVMFAAFNVLLARISGRDDLVVGTPLAGRDHPDLQRVVGLVTNTLAMRTDLSGAPTFTELLARVRAGLADAHRYQDAPFEAVVERLAPPRDPSYDPVIQVTFTYDGTQFALDLVDAKTERLPVLLRDAKFDLMMYTERWADGDIVVLFDYRCDLLDPATVRHWIRCFLVLLEDLLSRPDQPIRAARMLDDGQLEQILRGWNATRTPLPPQSAPELIGRQAEARPEATALVCGETRLSYRELLARADRLAAGLRAAGVGPNVAVGVYLGRTLEMAVAALAVLRAGGVYLPLETHLPLARIRHIVGNAEAGLVIASAATAAQLTDLGVEVSLVTEGATGFVTAPRPFREPTERRPAEEDGAYLIYTSGSTGVPKGVLVPHRALRNLVHEVRSHFGLRAEDRVLQYVAFSFDVSIADLYGTWAAGAELHIAQEDERIGEALFALLERSRITFCFLPPTVAMSMPCPPAALPDLTTMVVGGEACPIELVQRWATPRRRILNGYGPSEAAVYSSIMDLLPDEQVAIGRPMPNFQLYVLDSLLRPVPVGVAGELYLAGDGLARGYAGRPGMTAERFVADPFGPAGTRMYRTGDLAKYDAEGRVFYLGRTDGQVKLRGIRIELGEIEAALASHPGVVSAAAVVRDRDGGQRLFGYVIPADPAQPPGYGELRAWLSDQLPAYMVPEAVVPLEALPTNASGKLDRARLPDPQPARPETERPFAGPITPTERRVAEIWARVLEIERVGRHDNFFDLGGNSVRLLAVHAALRELTAASGAGAAAGSGGDGGLSLVDLFRFTDVAALAARLDRVGAGAPDGGDAARRAGDERRRRLAAGGRTLHRGTNTEDGQ
jgi:amino acid adenylation domain-containing protein